MECKVGSYCNSCASEIGINRNIVECKANALPSTLAGSSVLIETLWNVKKDVEEIEGIPTPY